MVLDVVSTSAMTGPSRSGGAVVVVDDVEVVVVEVVDVEVVDVEVVDVEVVEGGTDVAGGGGTDVVGGGAVVDSTAEVGARTIGVPEDGGIDTSGKAVATAAVLTRSPSPPTTLAPIPTPRAAKTTAATPAIHHTAALDALAVISMGKPSGPHEYLWDLTEPGPSLGIPVYCSLPTPGLTPR